MRHKIGLVLAILGPAVAMGSPAEAQVQPADSVAGLEPAVVPTSYQPVAPVPAPGAQPDSYYVPSMQQPAPRPNYSGAFGGSCTSSGCDCTGGSCGCRTRPSAALHQADWRAYAGVDYLFIRPHFSEAIAFAEGTQTPTSFDIVGHDLDFDYDSSFRVFAGASLCDPCSSLRFTYTSLTGDVNVGGAAGAPGSFLVDPFGNIVGAAAVIDPSSALFGQILIGGDAISTHASVDLDVFDLEFVRRAISAPDWSLAWSAGLRIADVEQFYASTVSLNNVFVAGGDFNVDYVGVGPRLSLRADRSLGNSGLSLFASGAGSLLVGEYETAFSRTVVAPQPFAVSQQTSVTRLIPVLEAELGAAYRVSDGLRLSAGWLFQSWFDMGTSGGTFGGFFNGADDGNIMSFDGLMLRAELGF